MRRIFAALIVMMSATAWAGDYEDGAAALEKDDLDGALISFQLAAEKGDDRAQLLLGTLHKEGDVLEQSYEKAVYWYTLAAEQGNAGAMMFLASLLMQGKGVTQNDAEASRLLKLAAAEGLIDAQWFLGGMYQRGRGLPQDFVLAHMWFNLSASQGDMGAQEMRENIAKRMTPQQIARAQQLAQECLSRNYKDCD